MKIKHFISKFCALAGTIVMTFSFLTPVFAADYASSRFYVEDFGYVNSSIEVVYGDTATASMSVVGGASLEIDGKAYSGSLGWYGFYNCCDWEEELSASKYVPYGITAVWAEFSVDDGYVSGSEEQYLSR